MRDFLDYAWSMRIWKEKIAEKALDPKYISIVMLQLCQNFGARQAVHGTCDTTNSSILNLVISLH